MTASALTRPGQRDRLTDKIAEIDWRLAALICAIAGLGAMMLYSAAGQQLEPLGRRAPDRFGVCFVVMLVCRLIDLRVWFAAGLSDLCASALLLLVAVMVVGHSCPGRPALAAGRADPVQPSEIMKIGLVLALARFYHGLLRARTRAVLEAADPRRP